MLGAIIGDIVGSKYEFNNTFDYDFEMFTNGCSFTDDTICTVAIMEALLHNQPFKATLHSWCNRYPCPMGGYGASFARWIREKDPQPYNSFGNGAAMRVSPIGWFYASLPLTLSAARDTASVSHNHVEGEKGACATACAIYRLRHEHDLDCVRKTAAYYYGEDWESDLPPQGRFDETCQGCVPLAFRIVMQSGGFEDAIRKAVSYGGDSDTLGAIVGSLAEAIWGCPLDLVKKATTYLPNDMKAVVFRFYNTIRTYNGADDFLKYLVCRKKI